MFSSLLVIVVVGGALFGTYRWRALPEQERAAFAKKAVIYGAVIAVLALVVTGKAHWLMGVLAALLALIGRVAQFAQYAPLFKKFMGTEESSQQYSGHTDIQSADTMSRQVAADILGVDASASVEEIKIAHKRLMQKIHPDRGGTDALAKQINLAKDTLLNV